MLTETQIENLAKHFFFRVAQGADNTGDGIVEPYKVLYLWNQSASQRQRFIGYAEVQAEMFPDCVAPYLDDAPF